MILTEEAGEVVPLTVTATDLATEEQREAMESMLLVFDGPLTVTDTYQTNRHGEVALAMDTEPLWTATDRFNPVTERAEHDQLVAYNASRMITLGDGSSRDLTNFSQGNDEIPVPYLSLDNPVRVGASATIQQPVVLDYRFQWNLQPTEQVTGVNSLEWATFENTRTAAPEDVGGNISIASFNVLNYFTTLGVDENCGSYRDRDGNPITANNCGPRGAYNAENLERQQIKIVHAINALDASVVGLEEIENSAAFGKDRDAALATLVDALNAEAGDVWAYVPSPSVLPADEDVIRLAFIYKKHEVAPVGESKILVDSAAFGNAREPLGQEFVALNSAGEPASDPFVLITNHFKSKGSGVDDGTGQGKSNPDRVAQATALVAFAEEEYAGLPVFIVGDLNSYSAEDPIRVLENAGYMHTFKNTDMFTYTFDKRVGSLDHILGNDAAMQLVTGVTVWNINSVEGIGLEYSRYNYNVTNLYDESLYRSSDHDPIKVGLNIDVSNPTVEVAPEAPVANDVEGTGSDTVTIPTVEGVEYLVDGVVVTGEYAVPEGVESVVVTARALEGYVLAEDATSEWTFTFDVTEVPVAVVPEAPVANDVEGTGSDTVTIPAVGGVEYVVDGVVVTGEYAVPEGVESVVVTARALEGYVLAEDATSEWTFTFDTTVPVPPVPPFTRGFLLDANGDGLADVASTFGRSGDEPLVGDWDGDGRDTIGVRRGAEFFLKNSLGQGPADVNFIYGRASDGVLVGDWNGDGTDTIAVVRGNKVFARNSLSAGLADVEFTFGRVGDTYLAGDWNGDGRDTVGVRRGNSQFLSNDNRVAAYAYTFGRTTDVPVVGDFDGDGADAVSIRRGIMFYLNHSNTAPVASDFAVMGMGTDVPAVGDFNGDGVTEIGIYR